MNKKYSAKTANILFEWLDSIVFSLSVVLLLFTFVVKTYSVQGSSMQPQFNTGDRVFALDFLYTPKQGDVVIIDANNSLGEPLIKRVAATAGQTVEVTAAGDVLVDDVVFDDPVPAGQYNLVHGTCGPLTVPEGHVFLLGDNRGVSLDSRSAALGCVDERSIVGRELFKLGKV